MTQGHCMCFRSLKMAVSFVTRLLTLALGYAYPAYDCYKTLELNAPPRMERLRFWCQYWILLAFLTAFEGFADAEWALPCYGEARLALVVYLWHPKTMGARHVYDDYLRPFLATHEADIDRGLAELRARAADATATHLQAAVALGRACLSEVARRVSSQLLQATRSAGPAGQAQ